MSDNPERDSSKPICSVFFMRKYFKIDLYFIVIIVTALLISCKEKSSNTEKRGINVIVSILPQKYFVKRIGGNMTDVSVIIRPGQSPSTYEPTPREMTQIPEAEIFFKIGMPFEAAWEEKIRAANPSLKIVDTREGIKLRKSESFNMIKEVINIKNSRSKRIKSERERDSFDPHIWLDPMLVKKQAETIFIALAGFDQENGAYYKKRYLDFINDLDKLDIKITELLKNIRKREILVFHPSWGYYTDRYNLKQIPVEIEGKEPGQSELSKIIDYVKKRNIRAIFIQKQFSTVAARAIADSIKGRIIAIDPLAENYIENMISVTKKIAEVNR